MFANFNAFKQAIKNMFSNPGEERRAKHKLMLLIQDSTVVKYVAKFLQLLSKTR